MELSKIPFLLLWLINIGLLIYLSTWAAPKISKLVTAAASFSLPSFLDDTTAVGRCVCPKAPPCPSVPLGFSSAAVQLTAVLGIIAGFFVGQNISVPKKIAQYSPIRLREKKEEATETSPVKQNSPPLQRYSPQRDLTSSSSSRKEDKSSSPQLLHQYAQPMVRPPPELRDSCDGASPPFLRSSVIAAGAGAGGSNHREEEIKATVQWLNKRIQCFVEINSELAQALHFDWTERCFDIHSNELLKRTGQRALEASLNEASKIELDAKTEAFHTTHDAAMDAHTQLITALFNRSAGEVCLPLQGQSEEGQAGPTHAASMCSLVTMHELREARDLSQYLQHASNQLHAEWTDCLITLFRSMAESLFFESKSAVQEQKIETISGYASNLASHVHALHTRQYEDDELQASSLSSEMSGEAAKQSGNGGGAATHPAVVTTSAHHLYEKYDEHGQRSEMSDLKKQAIVSKVLGRLPQQRSS